MTTTVIFEPVQERAAPPDLLTLFWAGDPPPTDRRATVEAADAVIEAMLSRTRPAHAQWRHHPHADAWWQWVRSAHSV